MDIAKTIFLVRYAGTPHNEKGREEAKLPAAELKNKAHVNSEYTERHRI